MKKLLCLIFMLATCSCASLKNYNAIEKYLMDIVSNKTLLVSEKLSNTNTLRILYESEDINKDYDHEIPVDGNRSKVLDQVIWNKIFDTSNNEVSTIWNSSELSKIELEQVSQKELWNSAFLNKYTGNSKKILWVSDVIYYKPKKMAIFSYKTGNTDTPGSSESAAVIMVFEKDKWRFLEKIYDYQFQ
ncbi:MAG: hypothetical protein EOO50_09300 [Flavobacterium sp.]|uniref:hypothetical protein n=1 Tax=Flavobacterium sp. TaxID=239 RepID=UPI001219872A|nr:hypothetical protein [Flavobacterium sp.]RZJ66558.1 MAG: hypothetical protein EOO50_09300 [Flavobacterium sp.]